MAQDFAKKNKNYPKATAASKKVKKDKSQGISKRLLIFFFTFSVILICCLVIYIQNGMTYKLEVSKNEKDLILKPKFEFYKILPNNTVELVENDKKIERASKAKISLRNEVKVQDLNPPRKKEEVRPEIVKEKKQEEKTEIKHSPKVSNDLTKQKYLLQLASFKDYSDADNLRAKLILSGIEVDIFKAKINNDSVWYRVRSKKTDNYQEVENLKNKLLAFRVKAIILKEIS